MLKQKGFKRVFSLIICMVMILSLAACGGKQTEDEDANSETLNKGSDDTIVDMEGYEFTIASPYLLDEPVLSEITSAEKIFEEVRRQVEKDYNCKITILALDNTVENVRTKIIAGEKIADVIDVPVANIASMARAGYLVPMETVDGLDLTDSRWIQGYTELTAFNEQHYGVNFMRPAEARMCMIYNRDLLETYGITEDPQELVASNEWTFDKFREMCKSATRDTNGDGMNDSYGVYIGLPKRFGLSMITANGGSLVTSEGGIAKESYDDSKVTTAVNFVYDLVNTDKTADYPSTGLYQGNEKTSMARFVAGEFAFYFCETWAINQVLKPVAGELDYGILPLPMGPDATQYVSPSQNARTFCITSTNKDVDKTVTILNALARYTTEYGEEEDWWTYELQQDYFQEGDTKSVEIYLSLLDNATCDLGVGVIDLWDYFCDQVVWETCYKNKGTPASKIDAVKGTYQSAIDAIYN